MCSCTNTHDHPCVELTGYLSQFSARAAGSYRNVSAFLHQHQCLLQVDAGAKRYETSSEMSIEFEVDGPYKVQFEAKAALL